MISATLSDQGIFPGVFLSDGKSPPPDVAANPQLEPRNIVQKPKRILVIDDEAAIVESLTEILTGAGYDAVACQSGQAAIDSAHRMCPDLVLSDVVMPKLNGVETVLTILALCRATHVMLFSGQAGTANILQEARAKGHEFELLPKPIHPDQLLKRLASLESF